MVDLLRAPRRAAALAALAAVVAVACGGREGRVETAPPADERPSAAEAPAAGETDGRDAGEAGAGEDRRRDGGRPAGPGDADPGRAVPPSDPGAGTPARRAAERLVEDGVGLLRAGRAAEAGRTLERAIRVDPSHGEAYHQLARVRVRQGREDEALGLLDRAVELLRAHPERLAAAEALRRRLSGG